MLLQCIFFALCDYVFSSAVRTLHPADSRRHICLQMWQYTCEVLRQKKEPVTTGGIMSAWRYRDVTHELITSILVEIPSDVDYDASEAESDSKDEASLSSPRQSRISGSLYQQKSAVFDPALVCALGPEGLQNN
ncbi:uncharacterized protein LOC126457166 [Schistocerca serialis cubense]|uniref:uncharacterized protein LOC126457166 n=1 Tax=Schistocerca serialis cubense TaxID=2023355 RepID=UPI00214DF73A|nr:uncharacterized protein LOC126457166 [Schistocerca serialis cubense]